MLQSQSTYVQAWFRTAPALFLTSLVMCLDLIVCVIGLATDHTLVTGTPVWIKPTKFAISTGIYALSLVGIIHWTPIWRRTLRVVEFLTGVALVLEVVLIDLQAFRHTTSHFNVSTHFDAAVYAVMGGGIAILWISSIILAVATFCHKYKTTSLSIAVRAGLVLVVLGAGTGGFMTRVSPEQHRAERITGRLVVAGAHSVDGQDGGRGLPILGWSTQYGDIRVAHFIGLHALQVLVLLVFFLHIARVAPSRSARIVLVASLSYGALFGYALVEALKGHPITDHTALTSSVWLTWLCLSSAGFLFAAKLESDTESVPFARKEVRL